MAERTAYPNAPITEAILDIRVSPSLPLDSLSSFRDEIKADYPTAKKVGELRAEFRTDFGSGEMPALSVESNTQPMGFACVAENGKQIVQARVNGFTFSRLRPYERWETFRAEARRLWTAYRSRAATMSVDRMAIRTINRLNVPPGDLKIWLRTSPEVSPVLPQALAGYFMQLHQPHDDLKAMCIINEALVPPEGPDKVGIILDVDLFRTEELPQDDEGLWRVFDLLRERKDDVFEGCITDRTRELFI